MHIVFGAVVAVAGLALVLVVRRAAQGKLARNGLAGIRTPTTLASDEAWLVVHREAMPWTFAGALAMILGGLVAMTADDKTIVAVTAGGGALVGVTLTLVGAAVGHVAFRSDH